MNELNIPKDDLLDIKELCDKLQNHIFEDLQDQSFDIALSALVSAFVNTIVEISDNYAEIEARFCIAFRLMDSVLKDMDKNFKKKSN